MKYLLTLFFILFFTLTLQAEVLKMGVSIEHIPNALFGSWQVNAKLDQTNSPRTFKPQSADLWELTRVGDVIKLNNPFNGANAEITIQTVEDNIVVFSKRLEYDNNKILTDTVTLRLNENEFSGINTLQLETFSLIDKSLLKTETARYHIKGTKISGDNILDIK